MDEEMEYAEMLEIPVATVSVVKKRTKRTKKAAGLKEKVISKVNDTQPQSAMEPPAEVPADAPVEEAATPAVQGAQAAQEASQIEAVTAQEEPPVEEAIFVAESAPVPIPRRKKPPFFARLFGKRAGAWELDESVAPTAEETPAPALEEAAVAAPALAVAPAPQSGEKTQKYSLLLGLEFAAAFALCLGIFLTNVFLPGSAINTFFRSLTAAPAQTDARTYADFTLSGVIYEEGTELLLSETGVLSFTDAGCVYPAVDGTVTDILQENDGTWTVKIAHSPSFSEVISGLSYAPLQAGDSVKSNVPVGYSDGQKEVQVTMYESGALLNCFHVTEDGGLAWTVEE